MLKSIDFGPTDLGSSPVSATPWLLEGSRISLSLSTQPPKGAKESAPLRRLT